MQWSVKSTRVSIGCAVIIVLGTALSLLFWHRLELAEEVRIQHEFEIKARDLDRELAHQMDIALLRLEAIVGFYNGSEVVDRDEFHHFTVPLLASNEVIKVLMWVPWVFRDERETLEKLASEELQMPYQFTELDVAGKSRVERADAEYYFPVYFLEPVGASSELLGFDFGSMPWALDAVERVSESRSPVSTIPFQSEVGGGMSFLVFWPISGNLKARGENEPASQLPLGFAVGEFHIPSLMAVAWGSFDLAGLAIRFIGEDEDGGWKVMHEIGDGSVASMREGEGPVYSGGPTIPGREWKVEIHQLPEFHVARATLAPVAAMMIGLVLTGLLAALYVFVLRRQQYVSDEKFRQVVDAIPYAVLLVDQEDAVTLANPVGASLFECDLEDLIGRSFGSLIPARSEGSAQTAAERQHGGLGLGTTYILTEGSKVPVEARFTNVETESGMQKLAVLSDLTERLEMEERQRRYERELERSNRDLRDFAFVASHDLKEPMRVVSSYCDLLVQRYRDALDEKAQRYIDHISSAAQRMQKMIQALLDYSRVDSQGRSLKRVCLDDVLDEAIKNLQLAIRDTGAEIVRQESLPEVTGDADQLVQVFQNLLGNALKFSSGQPYIEITARSLGDDPEHFEISVSDRGVGISEEFRDEVFNIFRRLDPQGKVEGTGIGLAICRRILERHRGKIWVESKPEQGCRFLFILEAA